MPNLFCFAAVVTEKLSKTLATIIWCTLTEKVSPDRQLLRHNPPQNYSFFLLYLSQFDPLGPVLVGMWEEEVSDASALSLL